MNTSEKLTAHSHEHHARGNEEPEGAVPLFDLPHRGRPETWDGHGASTGTCGDTIEIYLNIKDDRIADAHFYTDGCRSSAMSGSMAAGLAIGTPCDQLIRITGDVVLERLGGVLGDDAHCAWLAANALQEALGDHYQRTLRNNRGRRAPGTPEEAP